MKHVLLFEPCEELSRQLVFLLKLVDLRCTVARSVEELLNWLGTNAKLLTTFDLLLLAALPAGKNDAHLLLQALTGNDLPVISLQPVGGLLPVAGRERISCCNAEELTPYLRSYFATETCLTEEERVL